MTHVRPFGLRHVMLVRRLQNQGTLLDLEQALTRPRAALWSALLGQGSLAEGPVSTFVLPAAREAPDTGGFAQARLRPGGDEADVVFLAPSLGRQEAEEIWRSLLAGMVASLAHHRVQRVFARLSDELEAARLFLEAGFMLYTREDVFLLEQMPAEEAPRGLLKPAGEEARWGIARLYAAATPQVVRAAEGMGNAAAGAGMCRVAGGAQSFVWNKGGEIAACVRLVSGPQGHWMHVLIHPDEAARAEEILRDALSHLPKEGAGRVFCSVRAYQAHLRGPLQDIGFRFLTGQSVLVRQNAIPVKVAEPRRAPALEKRAEAHTPTAARRDA